MNSKDSNNMYRILSKIYDLFDLIFLLGGKGNPRSGLLDVISDIPQRILDVCVGTASSAIMVATHCKQSQITGIDISDDMLAVARRKMFRKQLTNLELKNMSADAMEFADNTFDIVMISFALHEFDEDLLESTFKEVARVLKPGGKFYVIDFARQSNRRNQIFLKVWSLLEPSCFSSFLDLNWHNHLNPCGLKFESEKEYSFSKLYTLYKE